MSLTNLSQLSLHVEAPASERTRSPSPSQTPNPKFPFLLETLPTDILHEVTRAVSTNDCKALSKLCAINRAFRAICNEAEFWEYVLRSKKWVPDWNTGMTAKEWYTMMCLIVMGINSNKCQYEVLRLNWQTKTIKKYAFSDCTSLALKELPPNLTTIEEYAFSGCINLALTSLPDGILTIGWYAFRKCTSLALTTLPGNVEYIGDQAFHGCDQLEKTPFGEAVRNINPRAFE